MEFSNNENLNTNETNSQMDTSNGLKRKIQDNNENIKRNKVEEKSLVYEIKTNLYFSL